MSELILLQALRLKGRLGTEAAAACTAISRAEAQAGLDELVTAGFATGTATLRISPAGRDRLAALLDRERSTVDHDRLTVVYRDFDRLNSRLKAVVTAWQLREDQTPNDHNDPRYDEGVLAHLYTLHDAVEPWLARVVALIPRLYPYRDRFRRAIDLVRAGDHGFVARPIADSYHTVWFELHEELIGLLGRTRADEAAAGRAL